MRTRTLCKREIYTPTAVYPLTIVQQPDTGEVITGVCKTRISANTVADAVDQAHTVVTLHEQLVWLPVFFVKPPLAYFKSLGRLMDDGTTANPPGILGAYAIMDAGGFPLAVRRGNVSWPDLCVSPMPGSVSRAPLCTDGCCMRADDAARSVIRQLWARLQYLTATATNTQTHLAMFERILVPGRVNLNAVLSLCAHPFNP